MGNQQYRSLGVYEIIAGYANIFESIMEIVCGSHPGTPGAANALRGHVHLCVHVCFDYSCLKLCTV